MKKSSLFTVPLLAVATFSFFGFYRVHYEVPVLMYHRIQVFEGKSALDVSPSVFERQMEFLKIHRYRVISLSELAERIRSGRSIPLKTVAITFDDGTLDNFENAFPVLKKMNFPATVFMITDNINREGWLEEEDLRILNDSGVSIGSHTAHHAYLPELPGGEAAVEIRDSKQRLEKILGRPVTLFSYPAGGFTPTVKRLVEKEGYEAAVTTNHGRKRHDPYALHRIRITDTSGNLFRFWWKLSGLYHLGKKRIETE